MKGVRTQSHMTRGWLKLATGATRGWLNPQLHCGDTNWMITLFLLLARYVPRVAKGRGVHENNVYIQDWRPTDLAFWKISYGHISATGHPIHFMFGSVVGFSGQRIKCLYFRLDQIQDHGRQPSCIIFNGHISETVHPVQFVFGSRVKV